MVKDDNFNLFSDRFGSPLGEKNFCFCFGEVDKLTSSETVGWNRFWTKVVAALGQVEAKNEVPEAHLKAASQLRCVFEAGKQEKCSYWGTDVNGGGGDQAVDPNVRGLVQYS